MQKCFATLMLHKGYQDAKCLVLQTHNILQKQYAMHLTLMRMTNGFLYKKKAID